MKYFKTSIASLVVISTLFGGAFLAHASNSAMASAATSTPILVNIDSSTATAITASSVQTIATPVAAATSATISYQISDLVARIAALKIEEASSSTGWISKILIHFEIQKLQNELNIQNSLIQGQ